MNDRASINQLKDWMRQLYAWHTSQGQNILRMGAAKGMGLDPADVNRPFPGSPGNTTITNVGAPDAGNSGTAAPVPSSASGKGGWLPVAALVAALASAAGGYGLAKMGAKPAAAPTPATATATTTTTQTTDKKVDPIELEVKWWTDEQGKVHFLAPTPVTTPGPTATQK